MSKETNKYIESFYTKVIVEIGMFKDLISDQDKVILLNDLKLIIESDDDTELFMNTLTSDSINGFEGTSLGNYLKSNNLSSPLFNFKICKYSANWNILEDCKMTISKELK